MQSSSYSQIIEKRLHLTKVIFIFAKRGKKMEQ